MLGPYQLPGGNRWPPQFECVSGTRKIAFGCLSWYYLYREYGGKFRSPGKLRFWKLFSLSDEPGFGRRKTILFSPLGRQLWVTICLRLQVSRPYWAPPVAARSDQPETVFLPCSVFCVLFPTLDDFTSRINHFHHARVSGETSRRREPGWAPSEHLLADGAALCSDCYCGKDRNGVELCMDI